MEVGCRVSVLLTATSWGVSFELEAEDEGIEAAVEDNCVETLLGDEEVRAGDVLTNIGVRGAARLEEAEAFEGRKGCDRRVEGVAESKKLMDLIIPIANNQKNHVMTFTSGCMVNSFFRIPLSSPFIREAKRKRNKDDFILLQVRNHICKKFLCFIEH